MSTLSRIWAQFDDTKLRIWLLSLNVTNNPWSVSTFQLIGRWLNMLTFFEQVCFHIKPRGVRRLWTGWRCMMASLFLMTRWIILTVSHFTDKCCRGWLSSALFDYQLRTYTIQNWDIFASGVRIWPFSCGFSSAFVFHRESVWSSQLLSRLCVWSPHAEWVFLWNCLQYIYLLFVSDVFP